MARIGTTVLTITARMATAANFSDPALLQTYLAEQLLEGKLALILGAGISIPFNLPSWPELIRRMYAAKAQVPDPKLGEKRQAEDFKNEHYHSDWPGFVKAVHDALYAGVSVTFQDLRKNETLAAIGSLVMASQRGSASEVVTFNFDDLLELYLEYHGFVTASVDGERHWVSKVDVTLLHPHGIIPFDPSKRTSPEIVLDQMSYSRIVGDTAKPWRQRIATLMRTHTCLLIGLSGNDDNLDSVLNTVKEQHASLEEGTKFWGIAFTESASTAIPNFWRERGIYCKVLSNYASELPPFLFGICQEAAKKRM